MRLKSFSVSNYRSFNEKQTIEFCRNSKNVTAIYGPNSAGKTNLFTATGFFRDFTRMSTNFNGQHLPFEVFRLNTKSIEMPSEFEAEMETETKCYKYGFQLLRGKVVDESLQERSLNKEEGFQTIFRRASIPKNRYESFTNDLLKRTRDDALVLTKAWEDNNAVAKEIFDWFSQFNPINIKFAPYKAMTANRIEADPNFKNQVLALLRAANLFIQDVKVSKIPMPEDLFKQLPFTEDFKKNMNRDGFSISTTHLVRDDAGIVTGTATFSMEGNESAGTNRIFELASPILDTLEKGGVLYLDEFENDLHPIECSFLVSLFESALNKKQAQLIINTHSTMLQDQIGRDNIRFISKNGKEESTIANKVPGSLKANDTAIEKKYLKGLLGFVPKIQEL